MQGLRGRFGLLDGAGVLGSGLLFLYVQWSYLRQSFLVNPLLHVQVVLTLLTVPLFWILPVLAALAYFVRASIKNHIAEGP